MRAIRAADKAPHAGLTKRPDPDEAGWPDDAGWPDHARWEGRDELLRSYALTRSPEERTALVARYEGLARALARRMVRHVPDHEDVSQVAMIGLLHAIDRYDPARGVSFTTFAWATIAGEIKRHYRGTGWDLHVPRRLQEAHGRTSAAIDELTQVLGRSPTVEEIARRTGDQEEDVIGSLEVRRAFRSLSLDGRADDDGGQLQVVDGYDAVGEYDQRDALRSMLSRLPAREREVVRLRFVDELSQASIAFRMGISQMHVSRLLAQSLSRLRSLAATSFPV